MSDDCRTGMLRDVIGVLEELEEERVDKYLMWTPRTYALEFLERFDKDGRLGDELLEQLLDKRWDSQGSDRRAAGWLADRTERPDLLERMLIVEIRLYHPSLLTIERYRQRVGRPLTDQEAWRVIKAYIKNINDGTSRNGAGEIVDKRPLQVEEIRDFAATHLGPGVGEAKINELIADRERILSYSD